jgi:hypothetical protein
LKSTFGKIPPIKPNTDCIGRENSNLLKASYGMPFSGGEPLNGHFSDTSTQKWKIALKKKEFPLPVFRMQIHQACQFNTTNCWPGLYVLLA